jgi:hypothetical protein
METLKRKLTSRKLWMSIASFVSMISIALGASESKAAQVSAIIMAGASVIGYVIGEGLADSKPEIKSITNVKKEEGDES